MRDRHCAYQNEIGILTAKDFSHGVLLRRSMLHSRPAQQPKGKSDSKFQLVPFIVGQVDDDGVFVEASKFRRVIVGIAEDGMKELFALRTAQRWSCRSSS